MKQHLTFSLDGERYGLEVQSVREVLDPVPVTRVPKTEAYLRGVLNLRGSVIPIIDPKIRFAEADPGQAAAPPEDAGCFIVVESTKDGEPVAVALTADSVDGVIDLAESDIETVFALKQEERSRFIEGIGKTPEGFVVILALGRLLGDGETEEQPVP